MRQIWILTTRSMKLYLKNPLALLFSFVYMLLIIVLFSLFLGEYLASGMKEVYAEVSGMRLENMRWLVDSTAMAGVLMINCILVPLNVLAIMVQDSTDKRLDSFLVSAASRSKLVFGYWLAPFLVGIFMNVLCLFISQGFIVMNGGQGLTAETTLQMIGLIMVNMFSTTSILFVVAMLIGNASAYNTVTGIASALVGFITGVFLPIGVFPASIQKVFAFIPAHYGATMMREVMTGNPLRAVFGGVSNQVVKDSFMTAKEIVDVYAAENGIIYQLGNKQVEFPFMMAVVIGSGVIFLAFAIIRMRKYRKVG